MIKSRFVVTEHSAKKARLHWDLRFRMPKSKLWASFACRKQIPLKPGIRILAVRTHDHTEKDALMTGTIEKGYYGAGTLKDWDKGNCEIEKYSSAHIVIKKKKKKLKGIYHLINIGNIRGKPVYKAQNYMLFKGKVNYLSHKGTRLHR